MLLLSSADFPYFWVDRQQQSKLQAALPHALLIDLGA